MPSKQICDFFYQKAKIVLLASPDLSNQQQQQAFHQGSPMHQLQGGAIFHHPHLNPQGSPYHTAALSEAFRNPHFGSPGIPNFGPLPRPAGTPNPTQTPIQFGFDRGSQHQTPILGAHIHQYQQQLGVSPAGGGVMVTPPFTPANNLPHFAAFQQLQLQQQSLLGASPAAMQGGNGGNPPGPTEGPSPNNLHPVQVCQFVIS